jgi:hypothetical protein
MESTRSSQFELEEFRSSKVTGRNGDSAADGVFFHEIKALGEIKHEAMSGGKQ